MTELDITPNEKQYRRSRRASRRQVQVLQKEFLEKVPKTNIWPALIWSLVVSVLSSANPLIVPFLSNLQTQNMYAGMAMAAGQVPYGNFFGTSGVLYYLLNLVGHIGGTSIIMGVLQFTALLIAGLYFYKIIAYFSQSERLSISLSHWFYLFILSLGFGGLYAEIFALPFILNSIWFLIRYVEHAVRDEAYILYGINAAISFLIYPKSLLIWCIAGVILLSFNMFHRQIARGIYQLLAMKFGFLVILYAVGYYVFDAQILGSAIQQTFLYNLRFDFQPTRLIWVVAFVAGFVVFSGFLKNTIQTMLSLGQKKHTHLKVLFLLIFVVQLILIIGSEAFQWSQLLLLIPYGLIMAVIHLKTSDEDEEEKSAGYLRRQFFLPLVVCIGLLAQPVYTYLTGSDVIAERGTLARYIHEHSSSSDQIYAWDNSASLYLSSQRLSAATIVTAEPYLNTKENRESLLFDLNQNEAKFIAINKNIPLLEDLKANLEAQYAPIKNMEHFVLYQKNE